MRVELEIDATKAARSLQQALDKVTGGKGGIGGNSLIGTLLQPVANAVTDYIRRMYAPGITASMPGASQDDISAEISEVVGEITGKMKTFCTLIITAATALFTLGNESVKLARDFAMLSATTGGTWAETTRNFFLGSNLGFDSGALASAIGARIRGGGPGAGWMMQAGINPNSGPYGDIDNSRRLYQLMEYSLKLTNAQFQRLSAFVPEASQFALMRQMSPYMQTWVKNTAANRSVSQSFETSAADLSGQWGMLVGDFKELVVALEPLLPILEGLIFIVRLVVNGITALMSILKLLFTVLYDLVTFNWTHIKKDWEEFADKWTGRNNAMDENTKSINQLDKTMREGLFGGGERARNAIPSGWGYRQFDLATRGLANQLGSFSG